MTDKICLGCKSSKTLDCFSPNGKGGLKPVCKTCRCEQQKQRRESNIEKYKTKDKEYHEKNKETRNKKARDYREKNKEHLNAYAREKYAKNKEKVKEYHQNRKPIRNAVKKLHLQNNPQAKIKERLMTRMSDALKNKQRHKMSKLLGCTPDLLKKWLEQNFYGDITWENYGTIWHIDHVVPVAFFDLTNLDEQLVCFHWSNLRPLYASDNISKGDKLFKDVVDIQQNKYKSYCMKLERYQTDYENSWWQRLELWYGKNPEDTMCFEDTLKWVIRNQTSKIEEGSTTK